SARGGRSGRRRDGRTSGPGVTMRALRLVAKLRGRSLAELRERSAQALAAAGERMGIRHAGEPSDSAFRRRLAPVIAASATEALAGRLREGMRPGLVPGLDDPAATARFVAERHPARVDEITRLADGMLAGRFPL